MTKSSIALGVGTAQEVPLEQWTEFLAQFTQENRGSHARLEIVDTDPEAGYYLEIENRPFDGVSADIKDRQRVVWIAFGASADNRITHGVHGASIIRLLSRTDTTGPVLGIETSDGAKHILELSKPGEYTLAPGPAR